MDEDSLRGKDGGEGHAVQQRLLRSQSLCSLRGSIVSVVEEHDQCHSLAHVGVLIPLYLLPLLFVGVQFGGCVYSLLLPLLLWTFNAVPKPAAALVHLVTLPLLGLMAPEQVASHYLAEDVLIVVLLLFALLVIDAWSDVVRRVAHGVCIRFGLRRGPLFAAVCMCAFVSAYLFSSLVVSVALLYFLDRVLFTIFREDMDRTPDVFSPGILRASQQESTSFLQPVHLGDQVLFDRLAQVVLTMKKPERRFFRRKKKDEVPAPAVPCAVRPDETERVAQAQSRQEDVDRAGTASPIQKPADHVDRAKDPATVSGSSKENFERMDSESITKTERKGSRLSRWRRKWFSTQLTTESHPTTQALAKAEEGQGTNDEKALEGMAKKQVDFPPTQPTSPPTVPGDMGTGVIAHGRLRLVLSQEGALNVMRPFSSVGKEEATATHEAKALQDLCLHEQQEHTGSLATSKPPHWESLVTENQSKRPVVVQTSAESSVTKRHEGRRLSMLRIFPWRHDRNRDTKDSQGAASPVVKRARPAWFRRISIFPSRVAERRLSDSSRVVSPPQVLNEQGEVITQLPPFKDRQMPAGARPAGCAEKEEEAGATSPPHKPECYAPAVSTHAMLISDESSRDPQPELSSNNLSGNKLLMDKPDSEGTISKASSGDIDLEIITGKLSTQVVPCTSTEIDNTVSKVAENKMDLIGSTKADKEVTKVSTGSTAKEARMADKNTGQSTDASKLSKNKARSEKDKSTGSKTGKRSGKKRNGTKGAVSVSDHTSAVSPNKDDEQHMIQGLSVVANSPFKSDRPIQTSGCDVSHLLQEGRLGANNNQSFPSVMCQHQSSEACDDCRRSCSEQVAEKPFPSQPEASKLEATKSNEPHAKREKVQGSTRDTDEQNQSKVSRASKSSVKSSRKSGRKSAKGYSGETKKAVKAEPKIESLAEVKKSGEHSPTQATPNNNEQVVSQQEATTSLENPTPISQFMEAQSAEKPSPTTSTSDKLISSDVSSVHQAQDPTGNTNAQTGIFADSRGILQEARRKQSGVSFGAGVKEAEEDAPAPMEHDEMLLVLPEEASSKCALKSRLSTILKSSNSVVVRRTSSVAFGPEECAFISPTQTAVSTRPSWQQSRLSAGTISSQGESDALEPEKRSYSLRRLFRSRSSLFDESMSRSSSSARPSVVGSQWGSTTRKAKERSSREDVHNAFLLGPSLMCVLGGICSFNAGGNKRALMKVAAHAADVTSPPMTSVTWAMVTLPGTVLALIACSAAIWLSYVRPHDPDPFSPENLSVKRAARERHGGQQSQRGVELASAVYVAIFSLVYAPALLLGMDARIALLGALASIMLATSLLTSCMATAFDFVRQIWALLPWGILLLLGATQVASRLMQAYDLPREAIKLVSPSFWKESSSIKVQAILAVIASLLAEAADKQVLIEMMAPVVVHIAEIRGKYPTYYAIPVIIGASSNVVMPASAPLAILHDWARVSFGKLVFLGLFIKAVVLGMAIMTLNISGNADMLVNAPAE